MKIVFFGTSSFSVTILTHLLQTSHELTHELIGVVTRKDKPQGRSLQLSSPPVKQWVMAHAPHIPLYQPEKASEAGFVALMTSLKPDLFVVASYGEIIKTSLLNVPKFGCINVHASLLPKWRGAAPIQRSLMAGEKKTGVTIMKMVLELDAGDILDIAEVEVPPSMNHGKLQHLLALKAKEPLLRVMTQIEQGYLHSTPQNARQATFAPKITPEETVIDWTKDALQISNQIRALSPAPCASTKVELGGEIKKMKISQAVAVSGSNPTPKQTLKQTDQAWIIGCGKDFLSLKEVQMEGKKKLPIDAFLRGVHHSLRIV